MDNNKVSWAGVSKLTNHLEAKDDLFGFLELNYSNQVFDKIILKFLLEEP